MKLRILLAVLIVSLISWAKVNAYVLENPGMPKSIQITVGDAERKVYVAAGMNCWTTRRAGRIGSFYGRFVVKFAANQHSVIMKYAQCEGPNNITSENRSIWASTFYRFNYEWRIVGKSFKVVTPTKYVPFLNYEQIVYESGIHSIELGRICFADPKSFSYGRVIIGNKSFKDNPALIKFTSNVVIRMENVGCYIFKDSLNNPIGRFLSLHDLKSYYESWGYSNITILYIGSDNRFVTATPNKYKTPTIGPSFEFPDNESITLLRPKIGDICWGQEIDEYKFMIVEFTQNLNYSIPIKRGGCITNGSYTGYQVQRYLATQGLNYRLVDVPQIPTLTITASVTKTPTLTNTPTVTVISNFKPDWSTGGQAWLNQTKGLICWAEEIAGRKFNIVEFTKDSSAAVLIKKGFCTTKTRHSTRDIYYYLIRYGKRVDSISKYP